MSEANTIFNKEGEIIGIAKFGKAWLKNSKDILNNILGKYDYDDEGFVYSNDNEKVASFGNGVVLSMCGKELGRYKNYELTIDGKVVGKCIGCDGVSALALVFIFGKNSYAKF